MRIRKSLISTLVLSVLVSVTYCLITPHASSSERKLLQQPQAGPEFNVRDFGAKGDGKALDSPAINRAIDAASEAGGGTIHLMAGNYRSFSIHLKSNITLYLDQGATIVAASPLDGDGKYDDPEPNKWDQYQDFGHSHFQNSLIWGEGLVNVSIIGPGNIWGKGLVRRGDDSRTAAQNEALRNIPENMRGPFGYPNKRDAVEPGWGNKSISLKLCRNVLIRDVTIFHGGHFAILATGVDNLTIDNLKIDTNRDGIDVDACRNVRISNCSVNSPLDDGICPKSSFALGYARATENVTITNCFVSGFLEGSMLDGTYKREKTNARSAPTGRIKFGTESNGGFKNITVSNCVFDYCRGLALETVDGALLEDVTISNITMRDVTSVPIFMRLGSRMRGPKDAAVGALRRININNLVVYNADPACSSIISGIPGHDIEDVTISNVQIYHKGGGTKEQAALQLPEKEGEYPEPSMFGDTSAYGFFVRHVKNLRMTNITVGYEKDDARPAFQLIDVKGINLANINAKPGIGSSTFVMKGVSGFNIRDSWPLVDARIEEIDSKSL